MTKRLTLAEVIVVSKSIACASNLDSDPANLAAQYLQYRATNSSPRTLEQLKFQIYPWCGFMATYGGVTTATVLYVEQYLQQLKAGPLYTRNIIYSLRGFYRWLIKHKLSNCNPWEDVQGPRLPVRKPRVLSTEELDKIESSFTGEPIRQMRDLALFLLLRDTGCRIGEILGLDTHDLHLCPTEDSIGEAIVLGKGNKERTVFFRWDASEAVRKWMLDGRPRWVKGRSGPLFIGFHGKRLNRATAHKIITRMEQRAGLGRHIHPHLFRHTFATDMLKHGANLYTLKELLGHASLQSTEIYLHILTEELKESYRQATGGRP